VAAFNYITAKRICPHCEKVTSIVSQTHMASDYDGDSSGRFMNRTYSLGEKWPGLISRKMNTMTG
jgi:hypothetical protein